MRPTLRRAALAPACVAGVWAGWSLLNDAWRAGEAAVVAGLAAVGPGSIEWDGGDQLWVEGPASPFVVVVGPMCSAFGPVLVTAAAGVAFAGTARARRATSLAAATIVFGNLVRMVAVVIVGARSGAADLELAHDGWATWWAVAVLLAAVAIVARAVRGARLEVMPESGLIDAATCR